MTDDRDQDIGQTFKWIDGTRLKPGTALPVDLHIYLPANNRFIRYLSKGDVIESDFLVTLEKKGIEGLYVAAGEFEVFQRYSSSSTSTGPAQASPTKSDTAPPSAQTSPGETTAPHFTDGPSLTELPAGTEPIIRAAVRSVVLAKSLGKMGADDDIERSIIEASLLKDIGLRVLPSAISKKPQLQLSQDELRVYKTHIEVGLAAVDGATKALGSNLASKTRKLIEQHHEKFNGTGYPKGLEGFRIADEAQVVSLSGMLDDLCSGLWDGKTRLLDEAITTLGSIEKETSFPAFFHPELLRKALETLKAANQQDLAAAQAKVEQVWDETASKICDAVKPET